MFKYLIAAAAITPFVSANPTEGDFNCGKGEAIDEGYATYGDYDFRCCRSGKTIDFSYSVDGGGEFSDLAYWVGTKDGGGVEGVVSSSHCSISYDSQTCYGDSCTSASGSDDCYKSSSLSKPKELCLYVRCDAPFLWSCIADSYTFSTSPISASWYTDPGSCSKSCGTGVRTMNRECRNVETQEVLDDAWCEDSGAPAKSEYCNTQSCIYSWKFHNSTDCVTASGDCGEYGVNVKETHCYEYYEGGEVDKTLCNQSGYVKLDDLCYEACPGEASTPAATTASSTPAAATASSSSASVGFVYNISPNETCNNPTASHVGIIGDCMEFHDSWMKYEGDGTLSLRCRDANCRADECAVVPYVVVPDECFYDADAGYFEISFQRLEESVASTSVVSSILCYVALFWLMFI